MTSADTICFVLFALLMLLAVLTAIVCVVLDYRDLKNRLPYRGHGFEVVKFTGQQPVQEKEEHDHG
jgi:hypothetical protein